MSAPRPADWFAELEEAPCIAALADGVRRGGRLGTRGSAGSSTVLMVAALAHRLARDGAPPVVVLVCAHLDEADEAVDELAGFGLAALRMPAMEVLPGESQVHLELVAERLALLRQLGEPPAAPRVVCAAIPALMQRVPAPASLGELLRTLRPGDRLDLRGLAVWLDAAGYRRTEAIEAAGEYAIRGGIVDLFPPGGEPARLDLLGDEIESISAIDLDTMGSDRRLDHLDLVGGDPAALRQGGAPATLLDHLPPATIAVLADLREIVEQGRAYMDRALDASGIEGPPAVLAAIERRCAAVIHAAPATGGDPDAIELPVRPIPVFHENAADAMRELAALGTADEVHLLVRNAGEAQRGAELVAQAGGKDRVAVETRYLHRGLAWDRPDGPALVLVPYHELLHRYHARRAVRRLGGGRATDAFVEIQAGDFVVHREHGIARFLGLRTLGDDGEEFLVLEFARGAKLNVPAVQIDLVHRYVGATGGQPELSTLGGKRWKHQKEKATEAVEDLAGEMLRLQAVRQSSPGIRFPADTEWQREFEAEFPYEETEDQVVAIAAVKKDMSSPRPMDRLVCGDVGFGKTEVAIRAAFKAAEAGKQVAVLVPTTLLAEQHERTFRERFADYPFRIASLSRLRGREAQKRILEETAAGRVDVLIGTHRILGQDVRFADLGLVIIDEEQRFGVEHKQRLLAFRATVDVLVLSATPIPRTLHMAMVGLRDISSLTTPPPDRRAIVTDVIPWNAKRVRQAIERELAREGQVFVVRNRVKDIEKLADEIREMAPGATVVVGHGQMTPGELEKVMLKFVRGEAQILVSTTIIESGIDIPRANTMIVLDADLYGLSELHQLRGRVGRWKHRAYCYLVLPRNRHASETAMRRLQALESFSMLGSGFRIALRDLELRGAGNLLGSEQSGHIAAVGYELYCRLLEQAVERMQRGEDAIRVRAMVDLGAGGSLPKGWIPSDARRMDAYRRIAQADTRESIARLAADLASAYGPLPKRAEALLELAEIRVLAEAIGVRKIVRHDDDVVFTTVRPRDLEARMREAKGSLRLVGGDGEGGAATVFYRPPPRWLEPASLRAVLRRRLSPETPTEVARA